MVPGTFGNGIAIIGKNLEQSFHIHNTALAAVAFVAQVAQLLWAVPLAVLADRGSRKVVAAGGPARLRRLRLAHGHLAQRLGVRLPVPGGVGRARGSTTPSTTRTCPTPTRPRAGAGSSAGTTWPHRSPRRSGSSSSASSSPSPTTGATACWWRWPASPSASPCSPCASPTRGPTRRATSSSPRAWTSSPSRRRRPGCCSGSAVTRLLRIRSLYYELIAVAILGFAGTGAPLFGSLFFADKFHLDVAERSEVYAIIGLAAFLGLPVAYIVGDRYFRRAPQRPLVIAGICISVYGILYVTSLYVPNLWMCVALQTLANAAVAPLAICIFLTLAATAPGRDADDLLRHVRRLLPGLRRLHRQRPARGHLRRRRRAARHRGGPHPHRPGLRRSAASSSSSGRATCDGDITLVIEDVLERYAEGKRRAGRRGDPGPPGPQPRLLLRHQPGALRREPRGGRGRDGGPARDQRGRQVDPAAGGVGARAPPPRGRSASSGSTAPTSSPSRSSTTGWRCWSAGR